MAHTRAPLHLGGPLGAIGLGCVGGAVALAIAAINNDSGRAETLPERPPALSVDIKSPAAAGPAKVQTQSELGTARPQPAESFQTAEVSGGGNGPAASQLPARAEGTEVHFIVRLKGAPEIDTITKSFKRDPETAQSAWQDLTARLPGLSEFTLVGASYSGEIKIAYQMPPGAPATPEQIRSVQDRLLKVEGVSYADPDYVAHPGKD